MRDLLNHVWLADELEQLDWIVRVGKDTKLHIRRKGWRIDETITVDYLFEDRVFLYRPDYTATTNWVFHVNQQQRRLVCYEPIKMTRFYRANPKLVQVDFQGKEHITFYSPKEYPPFVKKIKLK